MENNTNKIHVAGCEMGSGTTGSEITEFVKNFVLQAKAGLNSAGFVTCRQEEAHTTIDLSATEVQGRGGKLAIKVLTLGASKKDTNSQRITIFAKENTLKDQMKEKKEIVKGYKELEETMINK